MTGVRAAAAAAGMALVLAGCARHEPRTYVVTVAQMAYGRAPAAARVGDTIEWANHDMFEHTATAKDGSFDVDLAPGATAATPLRHAGTVEFYCRYHPGMTGRLTVAG